MLRWQPYSARLHLPLFLAGAVFLAPCLERLRPLSLLLCVFLLNGARPYLFNNWLRPLQGPASILRTSRNQNLFTDVAPALTYDDGAAIAASLHPTNCTRIALDTNKMELAYPVMSLLLQQSPQTRFLNVDVRNPSTRYASPNDAPPCALICFACAPLQAPLPGLHPLPAIGRHLVFVPGAADKR